MSEPQQKKKPQIQIQMSEDMARGRYCNLAMIANSQSEFVFDFVFVQPAQPKGQVNARVIMNPVHAKALLISLQQSVGRYEERFGEIQIPKQGSPGMPEPPKVH